LIGVIGLGFVGLTTALGFAERGVSTIGYDIDLKKTNLIKTGQIPFHEPGLKEALADTINRSFSLSENIVQLIENSDIIFICVGTPQDQNGKADTSAVRFVLDEIIEHTQPGYKKIVLVKSTVPPSTTLQLQRHSEIRLGSLSENLCVGVNPEFLREGHAWEDFMHPDRVVVGVGPIPSVRGRIAKIYEGFNTHLTFTTPNTAEFLKYLSNTLLSTLISFSNEMSLIAKNIGNIDIQEAFKLLHLDKRFSGTPASITSYIYPGCGYGGYCLPKDTLAIYKLSQGIGIDARVLRSNIDTNNSIMEHLLENFFRQNFDKSTRIGILGLSFKPDSDDVRETPAIKCIDTLSRNGFTNISAYDPVAIDNFKENYPSVKAIYYGKIDELLKNVSVVFIITAWEEFKRLNFEKKSIYDLRYIISETNTEDDNIDWYNLP
jgi:UDPglucose 6-dehydrogenase